MLDIPHLGLSMLNNAMTYIAQVEDNQEEYESCCEILDTARGLVGRTKLRKALSEISDTARDALIREKDIHREVIEVFIGKRMMD